MSRSFPSTTRTTSATSTAARATTASPASSRRGASALPRGEPSDPPDRDTVCGLGNRKNDAFRAQVREHGVEPFESTLVLARRLRGRGIRTAVVSASENCAAVLAAAGADELFDVRVDGLDAAELGLAGKPDPALFLEAARRLGVEPGRAAVVEDALAGVEAGRRGGFGLVVGVDRTGHADALAAHGADVVVADLASLDVDDRRTVERCLDQCVARAELPPAVGNPELRARLAGASLAVFSDYDGTLTPIVARPELALLADETLTVLDRLADLCLVAIISGRDLDDVRGMVHAQRRLVRREPRHGHRGTRRCTSRDRGSAAGCSSVLAAAADELEAELTAVPGAWVERKRFAVAAHIRQVDDARVPDVEAAVDRAVVRHPGLRRTDGKRIFELRPDVEWDKGRALWWVFEQAGLQAGTVLPIYLGDDLTDEDAFSALGDDGLGIVVDDGGARPSAADYRVIDTDDVRAFLTEVVTLLEETGA